MVLLKVVLNQLYQLMVETPSDHSSEEEVRSVKSLDVLPKIIKITSTKIQDIYHMKEH